MRIKIKRAYEKPSRDDGFRVLIDRLWPRGINKEDAQIDLWLKEVAPSSELRKWFNHEPEKWDEFRRRYFEELTGKEDMLKQIGERARRKTVTLIFGAKEEKYNNAAALKEYLSKKKAA
jgi:uncharacterized protein YeaO (DUF488 family)